MAKRAPFSNTKAVLGCSIFAFFLIAILGIILSFFTDNTELASLIRIRCFLGIGIGIVIIVAWKIVSGYIE
jgi:MFS family permease